jgi:hypothetical protein
MHSTVKFHPKEKAFGPHLDGRQPLFPEQKKCKKRRSSLSKIKKGTVFSVE